MEFVSSVNCNEMSFIFFVFSFHIGGCFGFEILITSINCHRDLFVIAIMCFYVCLIVCTRMCLCVFDSVIVQPVCPCVFDYRLYSYSFSPPLI